MIMFHNLPANGLLYSFESDEGLETGDLLLPQGFEIWALISARRLLVFGGDVQDPWITNMYVMLKIWVLYHDLEGK